MCVRYPIIVCRHLGCEPMMTESLDRCLQEGDPMEFDGFYTTYTEKLFKIFSKVLGEDHMQ